MNNGDIIALMTPEFKEQLTAFKAEWSQKYQKISHEPTPQVDGNGQKIVDRRPDGYDYIVESYMRSALDRHFPGWSWEGLPAQFLGSEWVVCQGHLIIIDEHLLALSINPPVRKFFGIDSVRVQYKKGQAHVPEFIVDVGDNCKQANTAALKYAINRLTHIGDDVYGKRIEEEGAGSLESVMEANPDANNFMKLADKLPGTWREKFTKLGIKGINEITDFQEAYKTLKGD